jgi:hypothetical protein
MSGLGGDACEEEGFNWLKISNASCSIGFLGFCYKRFSWLVRRILGKFVVRVLDERKWFRIVFIAGFCISCLEPSMSVITVLVLEVRVTLRLTVSQSVSQSVCLGVGHPFGALDQIFLFPFFCKTVALLFVLGRPLWREDESAICSAICQGIDGQSVSMSWFRAPLWGPWPHFSLFPFFCWTIALRLGAPSLTRGRVCNL